MKKKNQTIVLSDILDMPPKRWLLAFIFQIPTAYFAFVTSQAEQSVCLDNGNYQSESLYRANLNSLLQSLPSSIGNSGFYNASKGEANDIAYAIALCRGDIQLNECRDWVRIVVEQIQQRCPDQLQAIMWYDYCMVRYSNQPIFGTLATDPARVLRNSANATSSERFADVRVMLMDDLRGQAANGGPQRKAATECRIGPDNQTICGLVQCTPDLSQEDCTSCLAQAATYVHGCCDSSVGARVYMPSCVYRYEPVPFVNITRLQEQLEPSSPHAGNDDDNRTLNIIIIAVSIVAFLALTFGVGIFARKWMKQKRKGYPQVGEDGDEISSVESLQYDFGKIRAATNDFSDANKLGQGGFGAVYKGKLQNGREIAVKRLSKDSSQGNMEFKNEVLLVARLQHRNLVRLLGFSLEGNERLLIYEFVQNGSLDHLIFDRIKSSILVWDRRYKIIRGVARGLLYLHEDSRLRIIHRDLKASNILLDEEMNPKISNFGLAKLVVLEATQERTSKIVGTYGYMAPEYAFHGHFSIKSDVYSFGVLVLEIVTGQQKIFLQNGQSSGDNLLIYAWRSWREGTSARIIDPVLMAASGSEQDMLRCIHIALLCVQQNPDDRPTIASVAVMLNSFSLSLPLPSEPGFYIPSTVSDASLPRPQGPGGSSKSLCQPASSPGNDSSITHLYPR